MDIYGYTPKKSFTLSHVVWPLLAVGLALGIYVYLTSLTPAHIVDNSIPTVPGTPRQMIVANVMAVFGDSTFTITTGASSTDTTIIPVVTSDATLARASEVTSAQPILAPKPVVSALTKTSSRTALPKVVVPKFTITLATSSSTTVAAVATTTSASTSTGSHSSPSDARASESRTVQATTSQIQQLYEVKIPGGGGGGSSVAVSSGGGGGGSSPAPAPAPAPVLTVPDVPTAPSATAGNAQVVLSWTAPVSNGGASISDYEIQQSVDNFATAGTIVNDGISTGNSYTLTGLTNGTLYYFKISAVNSVGTSTASNVVNATPVAPVTVPDAPTSPSATAGNAQTSLLWASPSNDGGASITDYEIRQSTDNFVANDTVVSDGISTATSHIVTALTNGTLYYFKISAVNSVGTSTASNVVSATPVAPVTVPDAPTSLSGTAGDTKVSLAWTAPTSNGGSAITDYEVRYSTDNFASSNQTFSHTASTATSIDVTGLTNSTAYHFQVKALNTIGASVASNTAGPYTPAGAAPPPPPPPPPPGFF